MLANSADFPSDRKLQQCTQIGMKPVSHAKDLIMSEEPKETDALDFSETK